MVGNVILLDKLFKNREIKVTGNILSTCICIGIEVNPVNLVTAGVKGYSRLHVLSATGSSSHDLQQPVIQRIFFEPVIELFTSQLLVKQAGTAYQRGRPSSRQKRQQLVFLCADIDCIAGMIAVFLPGLRGGFKLIKGRLKGLLPAIAVHRFQHWNSHLRSSGCWSAMIVSLASASWGRMKSPSAVRACIFFSAHAERLPQQLDK